MLLLTLAVFESLPNLYIYGKGDFCKYTSLEAAKLVKEHNDNPKANPNYRTPCEKNLLTTMSLANIINEEFPDW